MRKIFLICVVCLTLAGTVLGQQEANSANEIQRDLTLLLLEKPIHDVTSELDSESSPPTVASLLRRLVIYSRAGQPSRTTLEQSRPPAATCSAKTQAAIVGNVFADEKGRSAVYYS